MPNWFSQAFDYITGRDVQKAARFARSTATSDVENILGAILTGQSPGTWSSDHYAESENYKEFPYIAVKTIANQMLQVRLNEDELKGHPALDILKNPNGEQSAAIFNFARSQQSFLTGTCVTWDWKEDDRKGVMLQKRFVIPTALLSPSPNGFRFAWRQASANTNLWMQVPTELLSNRVDFIPYEEVSINRFVSPLYLGDGTAPTGAVAKWIDACSQIAEMWFNENANAVRPGLVIEEDPQSQLTKDDRERVKVQLQAEYSGSSNFGKNLFLPKGLEAKPWGKTSEELGNLESFKLLRDAILAGYGVTPIAAGILEAGNRSAYYAALLQFVEICIQPYLDLIGEEDTLTFRRYWKDCPEIKYKARRIDDPDVKIKENEQVLNAIKIAVTVGTMKRNEIRAAMTKMFPFLELKNLSSQEGGEDLAITTRETVKGQSTDDERRDEHVDTNISLMDGGSHAAA